MSTNSFWLTLVFGWHYFWVDITFWLTLLFGWQYFFIGIALYCIVFKFHCSRLPGSWLKVRDGGWVGGVQSSYLVTPTWIEVGLDWIELKLDLGLACHNLFTFVAELSISYYLRLIFEISWNKVILVSIGTGKLCALWVV